MRKLALATLLPFFVAAALSHCGHKDKPEPPQPEPAPTPSEPVPLPAPPPVPPVPSVFVKAAGTQFELAGAPFKIRGTNFYRLGLLDQKQSDEQVYEIMAAYKEQRINVVRIWGFNCGDSDRTIVRSVKNGTIEYNEAALQRLDLAIYAASLNGIKIIMPLVNGQAEYCPMAFWERAATGRPKSFYRNAHVREVFKSYVATILTRVNTVSPEHLAYKDDPALMAIELANEPHTTDDYDKKHGLQPGDSVYAWAADLSAYIKTIDKNHLVSTGEEGYKTSPSSQEEADSHTWISNGIKGVDFTRNTGIKTIDFATVHPYPSSWGIPKSDLSWLKKNFIEDRASIAHGLGKPIILEESGVSTQSNQDLGWASDPAFYFRELFGAAKAAGYAGSMPWELVPTNNDEDGDYIFTFDSPAGKEVLSQTP